MPYDLPANKTRSTFKTKTHKGGGFNELRFEDKTGEEEVFLHAQKDRNEKIEHTESRRVNVNNVERVGRNKATEIGNSSYAIVVGDLELKVRPSARNTISPPSTTELEEGIGDVAERFGRPGQEPLGRGNFNIIVEANKSQTISGEHSELVQDSKDTEVNKNYVIKVGRDLLIDAGDREFDFPASFRCRAAVMPSCATCRTIS